MRCLVLVAALALAGCRPTGEGTGEAGSTSADAAVVDEGHADAVGGDGVAEDAVAAAVEFLTANCPYTRASWTLPFVATEALARVDLDGAGADVEVLRAQLGDHVALLEGLGVDLRVPEGSDHLSAADPTTLLDVDAVRRSEDPVGDAAAFVADVGALAARVDPPTSAAIEEHSGRLESLTGITRPCPRGPHSVLPGHPWTLGDRLGAERDALEALEPSLTDPEAHATVVALLELYEAQAELAFEGRAIPGP